MPYPHAVGFYNPKSVTRPKCVSYDAFMDSFQLLSATQGDALGINTNNIPINALKGHKRNNPKFAIARYGFGRTRCNLLETNANKN